MFQLLPRSSSRWQNKVAAGVARWHTPAAHGHRPVGQGEGARIRAGASLGELIRKPGAAAASSSILTRLHCGLPPPRARAATAIRGISGGSEGRRGRSAAVGPAEAGCGHRLGFIPPRNVLCGPPRARGGDARQQDRLEVSQRDETRAPPVAPTAAMIVSSGSPPAAMIPRTPMPPSDLLRPSSFFCSVLELYHSTSWGGAPRATRADTLPHDCEAGGCVAGNVDGG